MDTFSKITKWAYDRNLIKGSNPQAQTVKLMEEMGELAAGVCRSDLSLIEDSIGDCVVVLTILAEQCGLDIQDCIESSWDEIKDRKGKMIKGVFVKEDDL